MGRPFERLPPGAKAHLEAMAASGLLSESAAATALGMPLDQFRRVIRDEPKSKAIWDTAMAIERDRLLDALFKQAVGGDVKAAQTLLAVRHGITEKAPERGSGGVSITFQLPAALDPSAYLKTIQQTTEALPNGDSDAQG